MKITALEMQLKDLDILELNMEVVYKGFVLKNGVELANIEILSIKCNDGVFLLRIGCDIVGLCNFERTYCTLKAENIIDVL